ncbi:hypothetical protein GCK72_025058 [Caenorhabditis remanei]|uniref:Uncharacterized protein n=1 Tax=Caenorhabditis remanei TaxID=31234 RepID=A0A6A5G1F4_CAERE|nr:hypothetical protein GCK72_025058 [Caenorhabditis remanei]KAF1748591.1 hypothetical protein GCK72_025058 [Caenorhabditis remanei]
MKLRRFLLLVIVLAVLKSVSGAEKCEEGEWCFPPYIIDRNGKKTEMLPGDNPDYDEETNNKFRFDEDEAWKEIAKLRELRKVKRGFKVEKGKINRMRVDFDLGSNQAIER